ncbi:hypothetical protein F5X96DRAFT_666057 [Biscogniauxia mediterranea]|nr:hypothetical protein F5X96DRAFT_666057 [Biscogniauxia mediterranea]
MLPRVSVNTYKTLGRKIATCHAHSDGTWSIAFQKGGQAELRKRDPSALVSIDDRPERKVAVLESVDSAGLVVHHGEMIHKPRACRGVVAENNDEVHRAHRTSDSTAAECSTPRQALVMPTRRSIHRGTEGQGGTDYRGPSPCPGFPTEGVANLLDAKQQDLAAELARVDLRAKEQRVLFSRLKALPWRQQERILERSKALKA